jgi:hypothetical protein
LKKPNFFIVGAPKCGTTSLAAWLAEHPNIYISPIKEPHFFNRDGMYVTDTLEEYESFFAEAGPEHLAVGEASTHYLYSRQAVPRILEYNPDARFIVCIRNPIEMVTSLHAERLWQGVETVRDFEKAWRLQPLRKQGKYIPRTIRRDPERLQYGSYCRLGEQLSRLYSHVSPSRVLVLVLDDLASNPQREYQKVLHFLGITENTFTPQFIVHNQRKAVRWIFVSYIMRYFSQIRRSLGFKKTLNLYVQLQSKINRAKPDKFILSPELEIELRAYFEDDIHLLERLLGRDFSGWLSLPRSRITS